jgi:16S rRNA (guanine527-N7)-methyltransferase
VNPERRFTLIDSNGKKVRFVSHAARTLGLSNVDAIHARVESLKPEQPFDTVLTRAFAPLPEMLKLVAPLTGPETAVIAMKGKWPQDEVEALSAGWRIAESRDLLIPGLHEARCVIKVLRVPAG